MIGVPFNDYKCLGTISEILATMSSGGEPELLELAGQYPTTRELVDYIRSLPQRDDLGDPLARPRVGVLSSAARTDRSA